MTKKIYIRQRKKASVGTFDARSSQSIDRLAFWQIVRGKDLQQQQQRLFCHSDFHLTDRLWSLMVRNFMREMTHFATMQKRATNTNQIVGASKIDPIPAWFDSN